MLDFGPNIGPVGSAGDKPFTPAQRFDPDYYRSLYYTTDPGGKDTTEHGAYQRDKSTYRSRGLLTRNPNVPGMNAVASPAIGPVQDPMLSDPNQNGGDPANDTPSFGDMADAETGPHDETTGYAANSHNLGQIGKQGFGVVSAMFGGGPLMGLGIAKSMAPDLGIFNSWNDFAEAFGFDDSFSGPPDGPTTEGYGDFGDDLGEEAGSGGPDTENNDSFDADADQDDADSPGGDGGQGDGQGDDAGDAGSDLYRGGHVTRERLSGPNPPGPDDGKANLDIGEFIVKQDVVDYYGPEFFEMLNQKKIPRPNSKRRGLMARAGQ